MKKILIIAAFLPLVACNAVNTNETEVCSYNLEKNEKTCNMLRSERKKVIENTVEQRDPYKVVDGVSYKQQPDGTLTPVG